MLCSQTEHEVLVRDRTSCPKHVDQFVHDVHGVLCQTSPKLVIRLSDGETQTEDTDIEQTDSYLSVWCAEDCPPADDSASHVSTHMLGTGNLDISVCTSIRYFAFRQMRVPVWEFVVLHSRVCLIPAFLHGFSLVQMSEIDSVPPSL